MWRPLSTNFGAKRYEDHKFRTKFHAQNEDYSSQYEHMYQFRSEFKRPNDEFVAQNSDLAPNFKLDENNLLASLNSLILGEEVTLNKIAYHNKYKQFMRYSGATYNRA